MVTCIHLPGSPTLFFVVTTCNMQYVRILHQFWACLRLVTQRVIFCMAALRRKSRKRKDERERDEKKEENASRKRPMHPSSPLGNVELPESSNWSVHIRGAFCVSAMRRPKRKEDAPLPILPLFNVLLNQLSSGRDIAFFLSLPFSRVLEPKSSASIPCANVVLTILASPTSLDNNKQHQQQQQKRWKRQPFPVVWPWLGHVLHIATDPTHTQQNRKTAGSLFFSHGSLLCVTYRSDRYTTQSLFVWIVGFLALARSTSKACIGWQMYSQKEGEWERTVPPSRKRIDSEQ